MTTPTASGDDAPASSGATTPDPSNPPAQDSKKSDFERLHSSKEEWKQKAIAAEQEAERLREEQRKAEDAKLREKEDFRTLAEKAEAEAKTAAEAAAAEKARADALEGKVKAYEDQQEAELTAVLDGIPEAQRPPLDPSDPVAKRLSLAKHVASLVAQKKPDAMNGGIRPQDDGTKSDRLKELQRKGGRRSDAETQEMLQLDQELKGE